MLWLGDIEFGQETPSQGGLIVIDEGIDGWYDLPGVKTKLEDRLGRDGAYRVRDEAITYSARTVVIHAAFVGDTREYAVKDVFTRLNRLNRRVVRVRLDDIDDTYIDGYLEIEYGPRWRTSDIFQITVTAADPVRYAWERQSQTLTAGVRRGAATYEVTYPIVYEGADTDLNSTGAVVNRGNIGSAPVITVHGRLSGGFTLIDGTGRAIVYRGEVFPAAPVVVDCVAKTVMVAGVSQTWALTRREWFEVPPNGGSLSVSFQPAQDVTVGEAWAEVSFRDAWI